MALLSKLFWIALTVVFTFAFVVLFENGTDNYVDNAQKQFAEMKTYFEATPKKKADSSDRLR